MDLSRAKRLSLIMACAVAGTGSALAQDSVVHNYASCRQCVETNTHVTWTVNYTGMLPGEPVRITNGIITVVAFTTSGTGNGTATGDGGTFSGAGQALTGGATANISGTAAERQGPYTWGYVSTGGAFAVSGNGAQMTYSMDSPAGCPGSCPATTTTEKAETFTIGVAPPCSPGSITVRNVDGDPGGEFASHGFAVGNVFVGSGPGLECDFSFGDMSGESQTFGIPLGAGADGGAITTALSGGSQEYAADYGLGKTGQGAPLHYTVSGPTVWHCGDNAVITITWTGGAVSSTPTPTPGVTPTPQPSATASATASPRPTPAPFPTPISNGTGGYAPPAQSTPFPGASPGNVFVSNPGNFYGPIKQAMEDADGADKAPTDGGGAFGIGNGAHDQGNYNERGHLDEISGQLSDVVSKKGTVVTGLTGKMNELLTDVTAISGQTFGNVSSISMNFNSIGHAPAVGIITLPTSINLTPWSGMIGTLRLILAWLVRIAFFVLVFRLFASQGVRA